MRHRPIRRLSGPRLLLLVLSPWAKRSRLGNHSFDALAGSLLNMFDFSRESSENLPLLNPATGEPTGD